MVAQTYSLGMLQVKKRIIRNHKFEVSLDWKLRPNARKEKGG